MKKIIANTLGSFVVLTIPLHGLATIFLAPLLLSTARADSGKFSIPAVIYAILIFCALKLVAVKMSCSLNSLSRPTTGKSIIQFSKKLFFGISLVFLINLLTFACTMILIIPGIIVSIMLLTAIPAFVNENLTLKQAWNHSCKMTENHGWQIFGYSLITGILASLLSIILYIISFCILGGIFVYELPLLTSLLSFAFSIASGIALTASFETAFYLKLTTEKPVAC